MKCANCKADAFYIYKITEHTKVLYCKSHLPKFLEPLRKAGNLETTEAFKAASNAVLKSLSLSESVKKEAVVEPETVVESEAVVEESIEEVLPPKPKRKKAEPKVEEDASNS